MLLLSAPFTEKDDGIGSGGRQMDCEVKFNQVLISLANMKKVI